jgi:transcriptional regulator with XRE-family HTH domain
MEIIVHASQIKAARAMLDLSQKDLAKMTGLGENTIRRLEEGTVSPRDATNSIIQQVIENLGLELLDDEGIRRRGDGVNVYKGHGGLDQFFDNITKAIKQKKCGDVAITIQSMDSLLTALNMTAEDNFKHFDTLSAIAKVKCLLSEVPKQSFIVPSAFEFKITHKENISPMPYFIYGDKYANVVLGFGKTPQYVVYSIPNFKWEKYYA